MRRRLRLGTMEIRRWGSQDELIFQVNTPAPCEGIYGSVHSQCSERALSQDCAGAFGFGLLICIGRVCRPEAQEAVWQCCQMAYTAQGEIEACIAANAPAQ